MATAVLENVNKFSYLGLRRRPTYEEVIGLIKENETLTGQLPNRDATFFKASNEGSFFDGLDALEVVKEQQQRILQRQLRDILLQQNVRQNGGTYHAERLSQHTSSGDTTPALTEGGGSIHSSQLQAELEDRIRRATERSQQTGEEHREGFLPRLSNIFGFSPPKTEVGSATPASIESPMSRAETPALQMPRPQIPITISSGSSEAEMITARAEAEAAPASARRFPRAKQTIVYGTNIGSWDAETLRFQLFLRGVDVDDFQLDPNTKLKGKGEGKSVKAQFANIAYDLMSQGKWQTKVNDQLLEYRINEYKNKARSSSGI